MAYLNPRYNGRVGVYRVNEIERFGINDLYLQYTNSSTYAPIYSITEDINRVYILMGESSPTPNNLVRTYTSTFTESYTFSCTASVTLSSIYLASDGWLYTTGYNGTNYVISQMTTTGSQYRDIYNLSSISTYRVDYDMVENNGLIYCHTRESGNNIQVISASGPSASVVSSISTIGFAGMKALSIGSNVYYIGQRSISGSQIQVLKISGTSIVSSPYYTQILTFPTPSEENILNASTNGTDILISYNAGVNYPTSATASLLLSYDIATESFTPKIRTNYYDRISNISYSTNKSSYYYDKWYSGSSSFPGTYSLYKTSDESTSTLLFDDTSVYQADSNCVAYSNLVGAVISVYNILPGGSFPQATVVRLSS